MSPKNLRKISRDRVARHRQDIQHGETMPIDVHPLGDGSYVIAGNGRHRFTAYVEEDFSHIPVRVIGE